MYAVHPESHNAQGKRVKPFIHQIKLHRLRKETTQVWGLFDNGALVDAMSMKMYLQVKHKLAPLGTSTQRLRMANGSIVTPGGCWEGIVELGGATVAGSFKVFDSCGGWDFLFGKRLLTAFSAVHDYATDEVFLPTQQHTLQNQYNIATWVSPHAEQAQHTKMHETNKGDDAQSPVRGVLIDYHQIRPHVVNTPIPASTEQQASVEAQRQPSITNQLRIEEQVMVVGDRVESPSREVPSAMSITDKPIANERQSLRAYIEEVEDENDPRRDKQEEAVASTKGERSKGDMAMPPAREVPNRDTHTKHDNANTVYEAPIDHNFSTNLCGVRGHPRVGPRPHVGDTNRGTGKR